MNKIQINYLQSTQDEYQDNVEDTIKYRGLPGVVAQIPGANHTLIQVISGSVSDWHALIVHFKTTTSHNPSVDEN